MFQTSPAKSLVNEFNYPILGAGQMYEAWADKITSLGGEISSNSEVIEINHSNNKISDVKIKEKNGREILISANHYFSSIPITSFFKILRPDVCLNIKNAVSSLFYREHITVNFKINKKNIFPDQWIYLHEPNLKMARLANYNNFSRFMINDTNKTGISIEYFVFQDDDLWSMNDNDIVEYAMNEMDRTNLFDKSSIGQGYIIRETESYPTYYLGYKQPFEILKNELNLYKNITPIGRGGMYKYNNQDHSIYSGILAARNYLNLNEKNYDIWKINVDAEYHEEIS